MSKITSTHSRDDLDFYRQQSEISSPGKYASLFQDLPTDIHDLCRVVQRLLLHQFWILDEENYGVTARSLMNAGRNLNDEINLRSVEERLDFLMQMDDRPLTMPRDAEKRTVGNCRDYSLLLVSILRHQGIPARVRSGVARYFFPKEGFLEDHFICEFWNQTDNRWQQTDAQIDDVQKKSINASMDMANLPPDQFLDAGESFVELRDGKVKANKIGVMDFKGERYVRYKLVSDLACINSVEVLPWEGWGICAEISQDAVSQEDVALLDEIARILVALKSDAGQFQSAVELFGTHPRLEMPVDYGPYYMELPDFKT